MKKSISIDTINTTEPDAFASTPPCSVKEIPGLGPIRVRALQKAGLGDLKALRAASLEMLTGVPGMSENKARYIQEYLARFETDGSRAEVLLDVDEPLWANEETQEPSVGTPPAHPLQTHLGHEAAWCVSAIEQVMMVLMSEPAASYRGRLLKGLARFLYGIRVVMDAPLLTERQKDRARKQIQATIDLLPAPDEARLLERKEQAGVADRLLRTSDVLVEIAAKARANTSSASKPPNADAKSAVSGSPAGNVKDTPADPGVKPE